MIDSLGNLSAIGTALAHALFDGLWVGAIVVLAVHIILHAFRGVNAATRHAAWYAALVIIAAMPVISFGASLAQLRFTTSSATAMTVELPSGPAALTVIAPAAPAFDSFATAPPAAPPAPWESTIGIALAVLAGTVAGIRLIVLAVGLFGLARVKRRSRTVDAAAIPGLERAMRLDPRGRVVDLRVTESIETPAAAGFCTPAILLPEGLIESLDADALEQIALHEYAHLRRYDDWTNLGQRIAERFYWFNPAVWFVSNRVDLEREIACDDWAVAGSKGVSGYADCLWHLARDGRLPSFAATAPGAFSRRTQIAARIEHLLEQGRNASRNWQPARLALVAPILAAAVAVVIGRAPAIAWHLPAPAQVASAAHCASAKHAVLAIVPGREIAIPSIRISAPAVAMAPVDVKVATPIHFHVAYRIDEQMIRRSDVVTVRRLVEHTIVVSHKPMIVGDVETITNRLPSTPNANVNIAAVVTLPATPSDDSQNAQADAAAADAKEASSAAGAASSAIVADSDVTDDQSTTPADRNILAHCSGCDLSGQDLRNADLHGLTLTGVDFSGADMRGADLRGTKLTGVDLSDTKLDGADLRGALMTGSDINGATFAGAKTDGIKLVGMQVTNALLASSSARAILGSCGGCDLTGLDLRGRDLHGITLDGVDLSGVDFSGANLSGAHFNGTDLSNAKFDGANLSNTGFNGCDLSDVDLSNARTDGMQIEGSDLSSTTLPAPKSTPDDTSDDS